MYGFKVEMLRGGSIPYLSLCAGDNWSQAFPMVSVTSKGEAVCWEEDLQLREAFVKQHHEIVVCVLQYAPHLTGVKLVALPE